MLMSGCSTFGKDVDVVQLGEVAGLGCGRGRSLRAVRLPRVRKGSGSFRREKLGDVRRELRDVVCDRAET